MPAHVAGFFYTYAVVRMYYCPGSPCASRRSGLLPPAKAAACAYNKGTFNTRHMETLSNDILALLDALEADLEVPDFDADEMLDDEA
jgi:hypothetical protein